VCVVLSAVLRVRAKGYVVRARALARLLIEKNKNVDDDVDATRQSLAVSSPTARAPTRVLSNINPAPTDADGDSVSPRRK
jgi:hypothetical protein